VARLVCDRHLAATEAAGGKPSTTANVIKLSAIDGRPTVVGRASQSSKMIDVVEKVEN